MYCCTKINKNSSASLLSSLLPGLLLGVLLVTPASVLAKTYHASPDGKNDYTIGEALDLAEAGDTVFLNDGDYTGHWELGAILTVRDGTEDKPITIEGSEKAVIKGAISSRAVNVFHDYIHLKVQHV